MTANVRRDYGDALVDHGRAADAELMLRWAIEVQVVRWGEADYRVDAARISHGRALTRLGRADEAEGLLRPVFDRLAAGRGPDDHFTRRAREAFDELERSERGGR